MLTTGLAVAALVISLITFVLSYRATTAAERRSRLPVLVFVYDGNRGWLLRNVGNGPALNIIVAQKHTRGSQAGDWYNPVRVPPIAREAEFPLSWLDPASDFGLGAVYQDFLSADVKGGGRVFTVTCGNDLNAVTPGRLLPSWAEREIWRHWSPPGSND
ncbi:MAG TPA: hypothetical protein VFA46_06520 [Actinomycetes bacterium]|jgi:hypothetical protein|nr:hypothetical protein [Actinomycetes bacterium]